MCRFLGFWLEKRKNGKEFGHFEVEFKKKGVPGIQYNK